MLALSLDMGGTHIGCAVVRDRAILASSSLASEGAGSLASLLPTIEQELRRLLAESHASASECEGLAMGLPSVVDVRTGQIHSNFKKYEDATQLDLAGWCRTTFGVPLRMENDARMALLGEQYAGAAQGFGNVVMITLGTGIGGAAMILGRLVRGAHAQAACLGGHLPINFQGRPCICGGIGCAEAEAGGWSIPGIVREWPGFAESALARLPHINFYSLFTAAADGDRVAIEVRRRCLEVWAADAVALVNAYDPEIVVMGGGVMNSASVIIPFVQDHVTKHAWGAWGKPQVRAAALGNRAALLGAVPLLEEVL